MRYVLLTYETETLDNQDLRPRYRDSAEYAAELAEQGKFISGAVLKHVSCATTLRVRNSKHLLTDGPNARTKQQLVGFFLIEAANLDEAINISAKLPFAAEDAIEIRPAIGLHGGRRDYEE